MIKEYELRATIENVAKDMHSFDSNPSTWLSWILYLLEQLENLAVDVNPTNQQRYDEMVSNLKDAIHTRESTGGW